MNQRETVLSGALHSILFLLCTATNRTPHELCHSMSTWNIKVRSLTYSTEELKRVTEKCNVCVIENLCERRKEIKQSHFE